MKVFSIFIMVVSVLLASWGLGIAHPNTGTSIASMILGISGSIVFGSGVIALAITQAFEKK